MYKKLIILIGFVFLSGFLIETTYGLASPLPLPRPLDTQNFDTGKSNSSSSDLKQIYSKCNETFKILPEYLNELNETGSFPDEAEKVPMCFIKCYLENVGIWSTNNTVNRERAIELQWADTNDDIDECLPEMMGDTECEKAYYLTRCIVTRALVDGRGHDNR
uniref:CSON003928 protein n=1 Tax=Culicoides sonorensis TaxID=179676 RepID=A0A336MTS1_CULSO